MRSFKKSHTVLERPIAEKITLNLCHIAQNVNNKISFI